MRLSPSAVYSTIVAVILAGIIGGFFRSYDFNPWGMPIIALGVVLLIWSVASYRFGEVPLSAGWFAILGAAVGFIGLISVALVWGFLALILAAIAKGEIKLSSTPSH